MMFERSLPGLSKLKKIFFFGFVFLICLCLLVGPHPPNGKTHRSERRISFVLRVARLVRFVFVHWLDFFVLTCLVILRIGICLYSHIG
jgi:hypothetical protein